MATSSPGISLFLTALFTTETPLMVRTPETGMQDTSEMNRTAQVQVLCGSAPHDTVHWLGRGRAREMVKNPFYHS